MNLLSNIITIGVEIAGKLVPAGAKVSLAGATVTALQLETASASLAAFFSAMSGAIATKSFATEAELAIDEALTIAADLGLGQPMTGIASSLLPYLFAELTKIGSEPLVDVNGTWVSRQWADDPRHELNPDGSFKYEEMR